MSGGLLAYNCDGCGKVIYGEGRIKLIENAKYLLSSKYVSPVNGNVSHYKINSFKNGKVLGELCHDCLNKIKAGALKNET